MMSFDKMSELERLGSETAKNGFRNESDVVDQFNNWRERLIAQEWLITMGYVIPEIEWVRVEKISGNFKADIQVQITVKEKTKIDAQNIQVKLVSNHQGFNQIDKRWVDKYAEMWEIPKKVTKLLKYFTGDIFPYISNAKDHRRMFANEFSIAEQKILIEFFESKKTLIVSDILKGSGKYSAEWFLVIMKVEGYKKWGLKPINYILNLYGNGEVRITNRGSFKIGKIGMQRKGGDNGRPSANMLQFKINPALIIDD